MNSWNEYLDEITAEGEAVERGDRAVVDWDTGETAPAHRIDRIENRCTCGGEIVRDGETNYLACEVELEDGRTFEVAS